MENLDIFEKHFRRGMVNKDFNSFKRTHPTLLRCIMNAMNEVSNQEVVEDDNYFCVYCYNTGKYMSFAGEGKCPNPKCKKR